MVCYCLSVFCLAGVLLGVAIFCAPPARAELEALGALQEDCKQLHRGRGCSDCFDSGYRGRQGIYELLTVDRAVQTLLLENPTLEQLRALHAESGAITLRKAGLSRVLEGKTTLEEVTRAVFVD